MKQLITFVFLLFIAVQYSFGQDYIGVKAGALIANTNIENKLQKSINSSNVNRIGYQIGIIAQEEISNKIYVRSELFYSLKGYRFNDDQGSIVSYNYINLPILVGYKLSTRFSVFLGPQLGILGPVYFKSENSKRSENIAKRIDFNKVDVGIGAGVNYSITPRISVDLRYDYGLTNILVADFTDMSGNKVVAEVIRNNKALELSFNYFFKTKL